MVRQSSRAIRSWTVSSKNLAVVNLTKQWGMPRCAQTQFSISVGVHYKPVMGKLCCIWNECCLFYRHAIHWDKLIRFDGPCLYVNSSLGKLIYAPKQKTARDSSSERHKHLTSNTIGLSPGSFRDIHQLFLWLLIYLSSFPSSLRYHLRTGLSFN